METAWQQVKDGSAAGGGVRMQFRPLQLLCPNREAAFHFTSTATRTQPAGVQHLAPKGRLHGSMSTILDHEPTKPLSSSTMSLETKW